MPLDHERLIVYQRALDFVRWSNQLMVETEIKGDARSQLDRASISIPLNIAEGNGRFSIPDRIRFLDYAYGSALECSACLDVIAARSAMPAARVSEGKSVLKEIVNRLIRLRESLTGRQDESRYSSRLREGAEDDWFSLSEYEPDPFPPTNQKAF